MTEATNSGSSIGCEFIRDSIDCEASPQAINKAFGPLLYPFDYGPTRVAINNNKIEPP